MKEIGFVDVKIERFRWPSNSWPRDKKFKELGAWCYENFSSGLEAITMAALTRGHGWSVEDTTVFLMGVDRGMEARLRGQGSRPRELIEKGRGEACDLWKCVGGGCHCCCC